MNPCSRSRPLCQLVSAHRVGVVARDPGQLGAHHCGTVLEILRPYLCPSLNACLMQSGDVDVRLALMRRYCVAIRCVR